MLSQATYQALLKEQLELTTSLENNPIFKQLQLVKQLIESHESQDGKKPDPAAQVNPPTGQAASEAEKEAMVQAATQYWIQADNATATIKHITPLLLKQGIRIPGQRAGTTLGSVISKRSATFEIVDKKKGLWRLTKNAYEAAKRETAGHDRPAA